MQYISTWPGSSLCHAFMFNVAVKTFTHFLKRGAMLGFVICAVYLYLPTHQGAGNGASTIKQYPACDDIAKRAMHRRGT